jgi:regulatory protein
VSPVADQPAAGRRAYAGLKDRAYRALARREYSCHELRQKLLSHDDHGQLEELLEELVEEGALSDHRFAEQLGVTRVNAGKGPRVLEQELRRHRLEEHIVEEIMERYRDTWESLAEAVRRKKFGSGSPKDYREWARQARFMQQRGFTIEQIGGFDHD